MEKLPIKIPKTKKEEDISEEIKKKATDIINLEMSISEDIKTKIESVKTEKLSNLPSVRFSIQDDANYEEYKLEDNKIFINKKDYVEISDKQIFDYVRIYFHKIIDDISKADKIKNLIINIPVPKSSELIDELIKRGKVEKSEVKKKTKILEKEIDQLVYQLYDLNEKEIHIVEKSLK